MPKFRSRLLPLWSIPGDCTFTTRQQKQHTQYKKKGPDLIENCNLALSLLETAQTPEEINEILDELNAISSELHQLDFNWAEFSYKVFELTLFSPKIITSDLMKRLYYLYTEALNGSNS